MSTVKISQLTENSPTTNRANTIFVGVNLQTSVTGSYTLENIFELSDAYAQAAFLKANTPSSVANSAGNFANGAFLAANSGATFANASFITANAAYDAQNTTASFANGAFVTANASYVSQNTTATFANASFTRANSGYGQANSAASFANGAFVTANASYDKANSNALFANGAFVTANSGASFANGAFVTANASYDSQNTTASFANGAFTKANNTLSLTGGIIAGNVTANSFIANTSVYSPIYYSSGGTTNLTLSDIGIAAINSGGQETKFGAAGIESIGVYSGSFGGNKISLNNETNIISNRYDVVKIQTGTTGTVANEWSFSNNQIIFPDSTYQNTAFQGVAIDQTSRNTANSGASFANGAFTQANTSLQNTSTIVVNTNLTVPGILTVNGPLYAANTIRTPNIFPNSQTAIDIGFSNSSMVKANIAADLVVTLSSFVPGKFTDVIITNTSGQQRTITHGCTGINSSMGATTFNLASTRTCYLRYFSFNNDLANTYVAVTYQ